MEVFVSEKEIDNNGLNYMEDDFVEEYFLSRGVSEGKGFEFCDDVGLVEIQSLEQHEAEIRKPLEDEIERLKNRIEILYNAQTITTKNYEEQIPVFKQQSRQKVIAELEDWADENLTKLIKRGYFLPNNLRGLRLVEHEELKQQLKEMKGE